MITRRDAFRATAAVASLATLPNAFAAESRRRFTLDLRWGSIGVKADQRQAIELAARHGFESVAASPAELARLGETELGALQQSLEGHGLQWGSSGLPVDFRNDEATFRANLARLPELAAGLQRAGVTRMGTWIMPGHDDLTYAENFKRHARRLRQCARILADHGLRLGLEYVGTPSLRESKRYPFVHNMRQTAELHAEIGTDNMGFVLDSWHWYTAGETAADIRGLKAEQIVGCDLNDAPEGLSIAEQVDSRRELPAATGVIDTKAFLQALVDVGYDGPVRAEPFNHELNQLDNDAACQRTIRSLRNAVALRG
jgi:sugar phosphate isomerase/epimerase